MKLALGGAQFGMHYGVTNRDGRPDSVELAEILISANKAGIDLIDTAPAYGDSEESLGAQPATQAFRIVTKTRAGNALIENPGALAEQFERSLARLHREQIEGLLFHNADVLLAPCGAELLKAAMSLRDDGKVKKVGVSVYDDHQISEILKIFVPDLVQVPINVLDQRLLQSGALEMLKASCVEVHARSAFLQGVLLAPIDTLDARFARLLPSLERWWSILAEADTTPLSAALAFLRECPYVDRIVVGIAKASQLDEIVAAYTGPSLHQLSPLAVEDSSLIDPRYW